MKLVQAPQESESWDRVYTGFLLGEDDRGNLWLPPWRGGGEGVFWARPFNPRNPLHWPRWLNTWRRRALIFLEPM